MNFKDFLNERMVLKSWTDFAKEVTDAYLKLPLFDKSVVHHWDSLNESNHVLWKRLISKVNVVFCTESESNVGSIKIMGKDYPVIYIEGGQPYDSQPEMKSDYDINKRIVISIDHSTHPVFSVEDNIVFRTVHDFIVHILGDFPFGLKGELQAYNLHSKMAFKNAVPALFTEVVGQVCTTVVLGDFPEQKVALMKGFDFYNIGLRF